MTDDLVKRLRASVVLREYPDGGTLTQVRNPDGNEAADRIEALTAENERLRGALATIRDRKWGTMTQGCDAACEAAHLARAALGDTQ